ncbi:768_t:CDS:2 [Ambispora leptoticha]|uniref:768_t:CDS:1 n=1 Tax=Ambispora leptoticha TaxID=144679 RepID=A0A9N9CYW3_9GLOM|nr:768_t:CDS:2 [Ambispora leptoticha]
MTTYSAPVILYIVLELIGALLLMFLMTQIVKTKGYFTKWTLLQLCISAFLNQLPNLPPILLYGDQLKERAFESPLCIIVQKIGQFFFYPLQLFGSTLTFYLCYALARNDFMIERRHCRWVSIAIWGLNSIYQAVKLGLSSRSDHWDVDVNRLYCKGTMQVWLEFLAPTLIMIFFGVIFTLAKRMRIFTRQQNRGAAIKLGQAVRFLVCCLVYIFLLSIASVPRIVKRAKNIPDNDELTVAEYSGSIVGISLFLIFGTRRSAALLLPCFYYEPTESLIIKNTVKLQNIKKKENNDNNDYSTKDIENAIQVSLKKSQISLKKPSRSIIGKSKKYVKNKNSKTFINDNTCITAPNPSLMTLTSELSVANEWYVPKSEITIIELGCDGELSL